jgi:hypothetical protein
MKNGNCKIFDVKNVTPCFKCFSDSIMNLNYVVGIETRSFKIAPNCKLGIGMVADIFSHEEDVTMSGRLCEIGIEDAKKDVDLCLQYEKPVGINLSKLNDLYEIEDRIDTFWEIVEVHLDEKLNFALKYLPDPGSSFYYYEFWRFCYIFIDSKNNGMFIAADASD